MNRESRLNEAGVRLNPFYVWVMSRCDGFCFSIVRGLTMAMVCFVATFFPLMGQEEVSIRAKMHSHSILIGEQTAIDFIIRTSNPEQTYFIKPPDTTIHRAEILRFDFVDTVDVDDRIREITARMVITAFDSTIVEIPAFGVALGDIRDYTQPLFLQVSMPEVDTEHPEKYYGFKAPWVFKLSWRDYLLLLLHSPIFWAVVACSLLFLGFILYSKWKKRQEREPIMPSIPERSPLEIFAAEVETLSTSSLIVDGCYEQFYNQLIESFRIYLESELKWESLELTAPELTSKILSTYPYLQAEYGKKMKIWVEHSQVIRFAQQATSKQYATEDCFSLLEIARKLQQEKNTTL